MKKYIRGYFRCNLGDDLFLKILADRYNDTFYTIALNGYKRFPNQNIKFINSKLERLVKMITLKHYSLERKYISNSEILILLGGSMFMENNRNPYDNILSLDEEKKCYILGSNFGPFKSKEYYDNYYNFFSKTKDICFREKYSYDLFKKLPNVRWAPDIVFSLNTSDIKITNNKKAVISVIDCSNRGSHISKKIYDQKIIELIQKFDQKGYEVVLMSFCKKEGDEKAIKSILNQVTQSLRKKIKVYFYKGNIEEALNIIGDSQIIVGSRFHANILGLVMDKTIIPLAYSDKTLNVLKDINFKGKIFDIRNEKTFDITSLTEEDMHYKIDISSQKKDAEEHFKELDFVLDKKVKKC